MFGKIIDDTSVKKQTMQLKQAAIAIFLIVFISNGCSKKQQPQTVAITKPAATKSGIKKAPKMPVPKVISADDRAAKKTPDGRLYYDFDGKRYWRNYDDGKYYLFSKSMYNDPAFKPH